MNTTRREFLTVAAAAAPILSPIILGAQNKAGTKAPVVGTGAYTYEAIHDWGELPARIKWGNTHGVVEDAEGHIYVHHTVHATSDSAPSGMTSREVGNEPSRRRPTANTTRAIATPATASLALGLP